MDRIYKENVNATAPSFPNNTQYGYPQNNVDWENFDPTVLGPYYYYYVTESLRLVIQYAGLTPDPTNLNQLYTAIKIIARGGPN